MESEYNDQIQSLIIDRLKERDRKMQIINGLEKNKRVIHLFPWIGIAAACIAGLSFFTYQEKTFVDYDENFRGGQVNVENLNNGDYESNLKQLNEDIARTDSVITSIKSQSDNLDEELQYELQFQEQKKENLLNQIKKIKY